MSVLLIADINGNDSSVDQTSKALSAAKELGSVTILSFGSGIEELNNNLIAINNSLGLDDADLIDQLSAIQNKNKLLESSKLEIQK